MISSVGQNLEIVPITRIYTDVRAQGNNVVNDPSSPSPWTIKNVTATGTYTWVCSAVWVVKCLVFILHLFSVLQSSLSTGALIVQSIMRMLFLGQKRITQLRDGISHWYDWETSDDQSQKSVSLAYGLFRELCSGSWYPFIMWCDW